MNQETVTVIFSAPKRKLAADIEVPLNMTANDLVVALNEGYHLGIDVSNIKNCYFKAEKPIALLRGYKTLKEFGIRDGTTIFFSE